MPTGSSGRRRRRRPRMTAWCSRQLDADLRGDAAVVLDPAVALEVEDRLLAEARGVQVAVVHEDAVLLALELGDDLAVGVHDAGSAHAVVAVFGAGLGDGDDPGGVLVGAGLEREAVVKEALLDRLAGLLRVHRRRVEAEHDELDALQAHDAVGLGPAPVVADAHADDAAEHAPDREAEVARLEIALLEMLMGTLR